MKKKRWVIKAGSRLVCEGGPLLVRTWMKQVANLRKKHNIEVVWVTSGAISWAVEHTQFDLKRRTLPDKQALSAIGQPLVMDVYNMALAANKLQGAQVLLSSDDIKRQSSRKNLQNSLHKLLKWGVVPVLNENDAVSTVEIQFGDNDTLSAQVAYTLNADRLVILSDVEGLYNKNPGKNKTAQLIPYCKKITKKELTYADRSRAKGPGSGGMYSKLLAAEFANKKGITTHLIKGDIHLGLEELAKGKNLGTQIGGRYVSAD